MKREYIKRLFAILAVLIAALIAICYLYTILKLSLFDPVKLKEFIYSYGVFAPIVLISIQAAHSLFPLFPALLLILVSGVLFGTVWGSIYSLFGLGIGISVSFFVARIYGRKRIERYIGKKEISKIDKFFKEHGDYAVFLGRFLPLFPNNVFSFGAGLTKITYKHYFISSMLAFLPWVLLLNLAGDRLIRELSIFRAVVLILSVISLISLVFFFRHEIRKNLHKVLLQFEMEIKKFRWVIIAIIVLVLFLIYNNVGLEKYPEDTYLNSLDVLGNKIEYNKMIINRTQPFFYDTGGDKAVLLLHGFGGSPFELRELGEYLAARNISVYAPLLPGHGSNIEDLSKVTWQEITSFANDSLHILKGRYPEVYVAGLCNGGLIALYLAETDDSAGVISMSSPVYISYKWLDYLPAKKILYYLKYITKNLRKIQYGAIKDRRVLRTMPVFEGSPVTEMINVFELRDVSRSNLDRIFEPILVIQSNFDNRAAPESADLIYKSVKSKDKRIVYLENSGHIITMDYDKERVFQEVYKFVSGTQ